MAQVGCPDRRIDRLCIAAIALANKIARMAWR
jgi:hypothetical protein